MEMKAKMRWHQFLIAGLALLLFTSPVGCATGYNETQNYLTKTEQIINEATDVAVKASALYKTAGHLESSKVITQCLSYKDEYDAILKEFASVKCPEECSKLRELTVEGISNSKQELTEFAAFFSTGDREHLFKAESYYNKAQKALALAAAEWDRLSK